MSVKSRTIPCPKCGKKGGVRAKYECAAYEFWYETDWGHVERSSEALESVTDSSELECSICKSAISGDEFLFQCDKLYDRPLHRSCSVGYVSM